MNDIRGTVMYLSYLIVGSLLRRGAAAPMRQLIFLSNRPMKTARFLYNQTILLNKQEKSSILSVIGGDKLVLLLAIVVVFILFTILNPNYLCVRAIPSMLSY